jgi:hypothetical protein
LAAPPPQRPDRSAGRDCLLINLLVLPGFGSLLAGRKVGWAQIPLALGGLVLTPAYFLGAARHWFHTGQFVLEFDRLLAASLAGVLLFLTAWLWGLATGLAIRRASRAQ